MWAINFFHERQLDKAKEPDLGSSNQQIVANLLVRDTEIINQNKKQKQKKSKKKTNQ